MRRTVPEWNAEWYWKVTNTYKSGNLKTAVTESDNWEEDLIQGNGKVTVYYTNGI
ncbi:MAG: hypothetical protein ACLTCP_02550 [Ruminococcus bicirculans (ex Wegman et al. 2014)]